MQHFADISFRSFETGDGSRIAEITRQCPEAAQWSAEDYKGFALHQTSSRAAHAIFVARVNEQVAGFIVIRSVQGELEILNLAIAPEARRAGVASALLNSAFAWAKERNCREAYCEVRESNAGARAFYARIGFAEKGRRAAYYSNPDEDALILHRALSTG